MDYYYKELVRYLTSRLRDHQRAADVAHDAYVRVFESGVVGALENPRAFLYRTAINRSIDGYRRENRFRAETLDILHTVDHAASNEADGPLSHIYQEQRAQLLQNALNELPDKCREAFLLRKLENLSRDEIAQQMQISSSMVHKYIVNAMKHCRIRVREMESAGRCLQ